MYNVITMKFAVIHTGGKQYITEEGKKIKIEKLGDEYKVGDNVTFDNVVLNVNESDIKVGTPYTGAKVEAEIVAIERYAKIDVVKYLQKSRYYKKRGHRQPYFEVKITKA